MANRNWNYGDALHMKKHIIPKTIGVLIVLIIALMGISVTEAQVIEKPVIKSSRVTIRKNSCTVKVGEKVKLTAASGKTNVTKKGTWKSSKETVATISKTGKLTAKKAGTTNITITYKKKTSKKLKVVVRKSTVAATPQPTTTSTPKPTITSQPVSDLDLASIYPGETAVEKSKYTDKNGDCAIIPAGFMISGKEEEQTIQSGLVVMGPDGSEFVWVPTTQTTLAVRDFGSYFYGGSLSGYYDETELTSYQDMVKSTEMYGGFYMGRFEASYGSGENVSNYIPASKRVTKNDSGRIWVQFSPQDTTIACQNIYADNETVQGFFPWGINYDTTLQWLIDSGCKTKNEVTKDSTSWGNYSNDSFSKGADGKTTGQWEETKANNIYDLAGNNWEWTQERYSTDNYVMRGGGYNLMGGDCPGSSYPAALRDPLPGNDHHPNVTFRVAVFVK